MDISYPDRMGIADRAPAVRAVPDAPAIAPLIAIVGCDGSGKSTLSLEIQSWLGREHRTALCYLGLGSGEIGKRIRALPIVGPAIEAKLARKAAQTRARDRKIPGIGTALVVFAFSLMRRRRFRRMLALRRQGVIVVTDRYPQTDVPGFYDGPGLSAARPDSRPVAWLARRERRMYEWMAGHRPDVIIRLNVDVATAQARKPDHRPESLRAKVAVTPALRFNGAPIVDLDSCLPYPEMRRGALDVVRRTLAGRGIACPEALA